MCCTHQLCCITKLYAPRTSCADPFVSCVYEVDTTKSNPRKPYIPVLLRRKKLPRQHPNNDLHAEIGNDLHAEIGYSRTTQHSTRGTTGYGTLHKTWYTTVRGKLHRVLVHIAGSTHRQHSGPHSSGSSSRGSREPLKQLQGLQGVALQSYTAWHSQGGEEMMHLYEALAQGSGGLHSGWVTRHQHRLGKRNIRTRSIGLGHTAQIIGCTLHIKFEILHSQASVRMPRSSVDTCRRQLSYCRTHPTEQ